MTNNLCELLKTEHDEPEFFNQFEKSFWNGMHNCWISSELGPGIPRTNNALERHNGNIKDNFIEYLLLPVNEFMATFRELASKESTRFSNARIHSPMDHVSSKTHPRVISRIRHNWREGQKSTLTS